MNKLNSLKKEDVSLPLPNNSNRCKYNVSSITTSLQTQTEDECRPFFVDIASLPPSQIDHLRQVGLLSRVESPTMNEGGIIDMSNVLDDNGVSLNCSNIHDRKIIEELDCEDDWDHEKACAGQRHLKDYNSVQRRSSLKRCESRFSSTATAASISSEDKDAMTDAHQYDICLLRSKHSAYCLKALTKPLPSAYFTLDASRPWMIYWNLHSLDLLNELPEPDVLINIVEQLQLCWEEFPIKTTSDGESLLAGGYGGGPGQMAHCATTYAAVLALCIIAGCHDCTGTETRESSESPTYEEAAILAQNTLMKIRSRLYRFFFTLRTPLHNNNDTNNANNNPVGFSMHLDGESDVRGTYTVIAISRILHILTPELVHNVSEYVIACQTYEGGFGGEPMGTEAHGGYTFCAVAALHILNKLDKVKDIPNLHGWLARRQMEYEGGYSGRSNKLVDGCYSFWIGGSSVLMAMNESKKENAPLKTFMQNAALERYLLLCGQCVDGGLRDKPSKNRDFYHTCYCLSGLSTAQHYGHPNDQLNDSFYGGNNSLYGHPINVLQKTDPSLNIDVNKVERVMLFFKKNGLLLCEDGFINKHNELSTCE